MKNRFEILGKCERCGEEFVYYRKYKLSPASNRTRFCPKCRQSLILQRNQNHRKRYEKRYVDGKGYVNVYIDGKYQIEHRYVMEQKLGRKLVNGELVHHIDGVRSNNAPENLELWVNTHVCGVRASTLICPHCGRTYAEAA